MVNIYFAPERGIARLGMLAVDWRYKSSGLGKVLVLAAEEYARQNGCATMRCELLSPRDWVSEHKEFLANWYERMCYVKDPKDFYDSYYAPTFPEMVK